MNSEAQQHRRLLSELPPIVSCYGYQPAFLCSAAAALLAFAILLLLVSAYLFSSLTRAITTAQEEVLPEIDPAEIEAEMPDKPRVNIIGA